MSPRMHQEGLSKPTLTTDRTYRPSSAQKSHTCSKNMNLLVDFFALFTLNFSGMLFFKKQNKKTPVNIWLLMAPNLPNCPEINHRFLPQHDVCVSSESALLSESKSSSVYAPACPCRRYHHSSKWQALEYLHSPSQ